MDFNAQHQKGYKIMFQRDGRIFERFAGSKMTFVQDTRVSSLQQTSELLSKSLGNERNSLDPIDS